jgi:hypothetical protein
MLEIMIPKIEERDLESENAYLKEKLERLEK